MCFRSLLLRVARPDPLFPCTRVGWLSVWQTPTDTEKTKRKKGNRQTALREGKGRGKRKEGEEGEEERSIDK
jgi:hypothetical protein